MTKISIRSCHIVDLLEEVVKRPVDTITGNDVVVYLGAENLDHGDWVLITLYNGAELKQLLDSLIVKYKIRWQQLGKPKNAVAWIRAEVDNILDVED